MTNDKDILKRFMAGEDAACAELLRRLQPAILRELNQHYSWLRAGFDEILDAAETRLFEWLEQTLNGEGPRIDPDESIASLGFRLAKQEARIERHYRRRNKLAKKKQHETDRDEEEEEEGGEPSELTADARVNLGELEEAIDGLPEEMARVLMAEAERSLAGGAPLHEQLGITPGAARKQLERARKELQERLQQRDEE